MVFMSDIESAAAGGAAGAIAKTAIELGTAGARWGRAEVLKIALEFKEGINLSLTGRENFGEYAISAQTPEYKLIKKYVEDRKKRSLMLTGIRLRKLERNKEFELLENIKRTIHQHSGKLGVHLVQFVQSGLFIRSWNIFIGDASSENEIKTEINKVINELDKYLDFISESDSVKHRVEEIYTRIAANKPPLYMLGSSGDTAINIMKEIVDGIREKQLTGYEIEHQFLTKTKKYYVLIKQEE